MSGPRSLDSIYRKRRPKVVIAPVVVEEKAPPPPKKAKKRVPVGKRLVQGLVWSLILTASYLVAAPYTPSIYFYFHPPKPIAMDTVLHDVLPPGASAPTYTYYGKNVLTVGKIGVQSEILEGVDESTLDQGLWRRPHSSTPALGGNTVIAAHRYMYTTGPNTFYNLDKMSEGDLISLTWQGKQYTYKVYNTKIVPSSDTSVEENTAQPILTLYTCTPLWSSANRLVVQAHLLY